MINTVINPVNYWTTIMDPLQLSFGLSAGTIIAFIVFIIRSSARFAKLELKVDTMWGFQMRRAMSEVVDKGIGTMNSPLVFNDDARKRLEPLKDALIRFYQMLPPTTSDGEVLLAIEKDFGDDLLDRVCIPCGLSHGACLLLAMAIAKQTDVLELHL